MSTNEGWAQDAEQQESQEAKLLAAKVRNWCESEIRDCLCE